MKGALWEVRDNRTLGINAKMAYLMLAARGQDIRPSLPTLAADMGCSVRTAQRALKELGAAGLLVVEHRRTTRGDHDVNRYYLNPLPQPSAILTPPVGQIDTTRGDRMADKGNNLKTSIQGSAPTGLPTGSRFQREREWPPSRSEGRAAVADFYGEREAICLEDDDYLTLFCALCSPHKKVGNLRSYYAGVFERSNGAAVDAFLSKPPAWCEDCDEDAWACTCAA